MSGQADMIRAGLRALAAAPEGSLTFTELQVAMGATNREKVRLRQKLVDGGFIERDHSRRTGPGSGPRVRLTDLGRATCLAWEGR
jgi:DNA-binding MarR family transcriptional regulator